MTPIFRVTVEDSVALVTMDLPGEPVNKLNSEGKKEFARVFESLRDDPAVRSVVFLSGKPENFIAGADIEEFVQVGTRDEAEALSRDGQQLIGAVADFPKPVVAAIHGACLGGGLEFALACHYRIATESPKTQLGLPEVQLGLIPGAGGCQRLPRLVGLRAALDMILTGKAVRGRKALRIGLIDELVHPAILKKTALQAALRLSRHPVGRKPKTGLPGWLLDRNPLGRRLVYAQAAKSVQQKTGGHYPAPLAAIEAVRAGLEKGMTPGLEKEHQEFGRLAVGPVSRQLVQIFFATNSLKKFSGATEGGAVTEVELLGVIGSGFMGAGIAGTAASRAAVEVRLKDTELDRVGRGLAAARRIIDHGLERRRLTKFEHRRLVDLLSGSDGYLGLGRSQLVIEAVFEDLAVKRSVVAELEEVLEQGAVIASNTSTIPISDIAAQANIPERIVGMHFFSPVEKMPLLEVIAGERTSADTVVTAVAFGRRMGKTVITVKDSPGFWVNRILTPYLNEAGHLLAEGIPIEAIDRAMTRFGLPVGPLALIDEVGHDVARKAGEVMNQAFGDRLTPSPALRRLADDDRLGRKNGRGFYSYQKGRKGRPDDSVYRLIGVTPIEPPSDEVLQERLISVLLNEAALALAEGVVRLPRDGDIGAIFGMGFPPFRGGPLRLIDSWSPQRVVAMLKGLEQNVGPRFRPADSLEEMLRNGTRYYPD